MHDEGTTHYIAMIDQMTLGHEFLEREFNIHPEIGWQIDTFGHSTTQAALLSADLGFKAMYFARIDYQDYEKRKANRDFEFVWKPSASAPDAAVRSTTLYPRLSIVHDAQASCDVGIHRGAARSLWSTEWIQFRNRPFARGRS